MPTARHLRAASVAGVCLLFAVSSVHAAVVVRTWKPSGATRYLTVCWADAVVDLPASPAAVEGAVCSVEADNTTHVYHDGAWVELAGGVGGGDSFKTIDAPAGTDPVADSATDTLAIACSGGLTCTGDSSTDTLTIDASGVSGGLTHPQTMARLAVGGGY